MSLVLNLELRRRAAEHENLLAQREVREMERLGELHDRVGELQHKARESADRGVIAEARGYLREAFQVLQDEPRLAEMRSPLATLQHEVADKEAKQQQAQEAQKTYQDFFRLRDTALFHGMVFTGVDLPGNVMVTAKKCEEALALFSIRLAPGADAPASPSPGADAPGSPSPGADAPGTPVLPQPLSDIQKRRCLLACYELLLVWAETLAQPGPERQTPTRAQLKAALNLLDRAARLNVPATQAYHLRRAGYLELLGRLEDADQQRRLAARNQPRSAWIIFSPGTSTRNRASWTGPAPLSPAPCGPNRTISGPAIFWRSATCSS